MDSYIQNELVECNRLRSQEAISGNNENPALWTNTLSNIYELQAGDKVSMYNGFISEKGAGSLKTIELKGASLGKKKSFTYTTETITRQKLTNAPIEATVTETTQEIELKDNVVNLILGYYKNTNGTGYMALPRKFINLENSGEQTTTGQATGYAFETIDTVDTGYIQPVADYFSLIKDDYYIEPASKNFKIRNDNKKFTLFVAPFSKLGVETSSGINAGQGDEPFENFTIEPEFRKYKRFKQLVTLEVPKGFNSAQFIADELTKQLQAIEQETNLEFCRNIEQYEYQNPTPNIRISKTVESKTYKTFNCATQLTFEESTYDELVTDPSFTSSYYNNFQNVLWKRPELYETGEHINIHWTLDSPTPPNKFINLEEQRLLGSELREDYDYSIDNEPMRTSILYTKENLDKLKKFINTQEMYPEIWESWTGEHKYYGNGLYTSNNTIDNTRWFHMNQLSCVRSCELNPISDDASSQTYTRAVNGNNPAGTNTLRLAWDGTDADRIVPVDFFAILISDSVDGSTLSDALVQSVSYNVSPPYQTVLLSKNIGGSGLNAPATVSIEQVDIDEGTIRYASQRTMLGSSRLRDNYYVVPGQTFQEQRYSRLLLVYYNKDDRDTYYDEPDFTQNKLTYGCFGKELYEIDDGYGGKISGYFINIYPNVSRTNLSFPQSFFDSQSRGIIEEGRKWGYDLHFSAIGNPAITLYNGKTSQYANYYGFQFPRTFVLPIWGETVYEEHEKISQEEESALLGGFLTRRYMGADNPQIKWDGEHFNISDLHTAENLGSRSADGGRYSELILTGTGQTDYNYVTTDVPTDASSIVYKINPRQDYNEYCPALAPYNGTMLTHTKNGTAGTGNLFIEVFNKNYTPYEIYDSKSGVFFEDMGYDEDTWTEGLWGIMGFSYKQFHGTTNRLDRIGNTNITNLKYPTTNAEIKAVDTKNWNTNDNGVPHFSDNLPCPFALFTYDQAGHTANFGNTLQPFAQLYPSINLKTQSIDLTAENFPTSMIKGYYTIRSDIVPQSIFVGGKSNITNMPIVGTITKENPQADYFFGGEDGIEFTIAKPIKLSSITCSIHDPDGSFANVNNSSSIIFKIQRQIKTSFNIIEQILSDKNNSKKSNL